MTSRKQGSLQSRKPAIRSPGAVNSKGTPKAKKPKIANSPPGQVTPKAKKPKTANSPPGQGTPKAKKLEAANSPPDQGAVTSIRFRVGGRNPFVPGTKAYERMLANYRILREWSKGSCSYFDVDPSAPGGKANEPYIPNFTPGAKQFLEHFIAKCDRSDVASRARKALSQAGSKVRKPEYSPAVTSHGCTHCRACRKQKHIILDPPGLTW